MAGKPGKYMSMEKGPIAHSKPRININKERFLFSIFAKKSHYPEVKKSLAANVNRPSFT